MVTWRRGHGRVSVKLFIFGAVLILANTAVANDRISINCGSSKQFTTPTGREWIGDLRSEFFTVEGSSTAVSSKDDLDLVPYSTARVSRSQFSYRFRLNPGEKFIRLHFSRDRRKEITDFFTVEAGPFTLLHNFSASITARAAAQDAVVKEFCLTIEKNRQQFDVTFTPTQSPFYAFVNGIEILSPPPGLSYCHGGATEVPIVGQNDPAAEIDRGTALETVRRVDLKLDPSPNLISDSGSIFRIWERRLNQKQGFEVEKNITWRISLDVGFRHLVRVHFSETGLKIAETRGKDFSVVIDGMIAATAIDVLRSRDDEEDEAFSWHRNYMVMVNGIHKRECNREVVITLHSEGGFRDGGNSVFEGFEVFKISNHENSLAGRNPNLLPASDSSPLNTMDTLFMLIGHRNLFATAFVMLISVINIIFHLLRRIHGDEFITEEVVVKKPSPRAERLFRLFKLDEIKSATDDFHVRFLIGRGGFGDVYKGVIDNVKETVAIKRLKPDSKQGKREFWTEIETLSELRHVNLVSLLGYCKEMREMILVYEYIPSGSLADHLFKLAGKNEASPSLSWAKRLKICVGAGRGLDYLHTGHRVIHRDIKASNILLDENMLAKVSDFGLAKWEDGRVLHSQESQHVKGTLGYMDPDYFRTGELTTKSDTYSFGVVLLEVLCGRRAVEASALEENRSLTLWAQSKISKGEVDSIIDPSIKMELLPDSLTTFLRITEKCLLDDPSKRPTIAHVLINLEMALEQQQLGKSFMPKEITRITDFLPVTEFKSQTLQGRKGAMQKLVRFLPFNSGWSTRKSSKTNDPVPISAPISRRKGKVTFKGDDTLYKKTIYGIKELNSSSSARVFSFSELHTATENFTTILGKGGFGTVYKGWLKGNLGVGNGNRYPVAVKRLSSSSAQGIEEWKSEVIFLAKISHPNLVKLLGYCCEKKNLLLVYEFMELGSFDNHLFKRNSVAPTLPWDTRLRILIGVARGLAFLHSIKVIWRDVKASNILLDGSFSPKISDFGLAKSGPMDGFTHVSTRLMGTFGYVAPEYAMTGRLYVKSDVYGFGVVMLETLTGLSITDVYRPPKGWNLVEWMNPLLRKKGELKKIMDSSLNGNYSPNAAHQAACLAKACLGSRPESRPSMQQVVESLEKISSLSDQEQPDYT